MKIIGLLLVILFSLILFLCVGEVPFEERVSTFYLKDASKTIKTANVVTAIVWGYRGYDTLGEETILFTATVAVVALMIGGTKNARKNNE